VESEEWRVDLVVMALLPVKITMSLREGPEGRRGNLNSNPMECSRRTLMHISILEKLTDELLAEFAGIPAHVNRHTAVGQQHQFHQCKDTRC